MPRKTYYGNEARDILLRGVDKLGRAVKSTLGPKGRNAVIHRGYGLPIVTKDGVTVAKEMEAEDPGEQLGVELVRQAAMKTNDAVGDGTTTSTVLAQTMIRVALDRLKLFPHLDVHAMRAGMEGAVTRLCANLDKMAVKIEDDLEKLVQVATISANNDPVMGKLIAELMHEVGKDGVVTVDDSNEVGLKVERVEGMQFARGYVSRYMMTDHDRQVAELGDPVVIVTDYRVTTKAEIVALIQPAIQAGRKDVFLVAEALEGDALSIVVANGPTFSKNFNVVSVTPPGYGDRKKEMLDDICALTGARLVSQELGQKLESVTEADYGSCRRVTVEADKTTLVGGKGAEDAIKARVSSIRVSLEKPGLSFFDQEKLRERLAKLTGGVAVIKVGALTESEAKEKRYLIEDAVSAVKAAMQEGIVAGGGMALLRASERNSTWYADKALAEGDSVVTAAIHAPFNAIIRNAGQNPMDFYEVRGWFRMKEPKRKIPQRGGYDAKRDQVVPDMLAAGIVDPVSVTKSALKNAVSVAGSLLTTETLVVEVPEARSPQVAA